MAKYVEIDNLEVGDYVTIWDCNCSEFGKQTVMAVDDLQYLPTADVVEFETLKKWLYEIAINNVGCVLDGDFSTACEEIISRLDGLRKFAQEKGGVDETAEGTAKRCFTPEEVRKMTREEVRANYTAVMNSMKEWK